VDVSQREFLTTLAHLIHAPDVLSDLALEARQVRPQVFLGAASSHFRTAHCFGTNCPPRFTLLGTSSPQQAQERFSLVGTFSFLTLEERRDIALSSALDSVWDGVSLAVGDTLNPQALRMIAYIGCIPLWNMVDAYKRLLEDTDRATSLAQLESGGQRFGRVLGENGTRVLIMVALSAVGGRGGISTHGPSLPGYARAALAAQRNAGFRLPALAEGTLTSVTVRPGTLLLATAPTAVMVTSWAMHGAGGPQPQPKGRLSGRPSQPKANDDAISVRSIQRENESAQILAKNGYDVEQNPAKPSGSNKKPDYKLDGEYADCYAPTSDRVRNIWTGIQQKIMEGQANIVVLNLDDTPIALEAMKKQMMDWPIQGLQRVLGLKNGQVVNIFP